MRAHLWPTTPSNPHMAFTFNLLDWAEALLLECQVSVQDLCKALYFKCPYKIFKVCLYVIQNYILIDFYNFRDEIFTNHFLSRLKNTGNTVGYRTCHAY